MKKIFLQAAILALLAVTACAPREREVVILSTNDIHARIDRFPQLAAAVAACRDTAAVILVDAGDRWTGNAYVDQVPGRRPILDLMGALRYDVATLGNHEFDVGQEALGKALRGGAFPVICANMTSDTTAIDNLPPYLMVERGGVRVGFVGVVTNYGYNNHPDGHDSVFEGLRFADAVETLEEYEWLADECDLLVALTHIGTEHDLEAAEELAAYDLIIGGHTHDRNNLLENGVLITQTGRNLQAVGATTVRLRNDEVVELSYELIPLEGYTSDPEMARRVEAYYANPDLKRVAGELTATADKAGLANLFLQAQLLRTGDEVAFYHRGGIRRDSLAAGVVTRGDLFDLDPFISHISRLRMTPEQMRRMVIEKFNDTTNPKESHRVDLFSSTPYEIVVDERGEAVDVRFPALQEGRPYRVNMGDYVFENYRAMEYTDGETTRLDIPSALLDYLEVQGGMLTPDNTLRQQIVSR